MTDKEQALVATAYRAALHEVATLLNHSEKDGHTSVANHLIGIVMEDIASLAPSDAEAKLRELMVRVAEKVSNIPRGKTYSVEDIVAEVLNA